ncbi:MAG: tRNA(Ile)(2)-agmatinylcytidine synthase [Nitrososphaerota archaeon]|nr:tRNA(Ile)(2)-agmatinylcytidine synthase [Nitrososphaerota archaeon]
MAIWVGVDDTDSRKGGCTTYVAAVLLRRLGNVGVEVMGYPRLIRLNPNCPYKTRGNAAVALKLDASDLDLVKRLTIKVVEEYSELDEGAETGIILLRGEPPQKLREFYWKAVREIVPIEEAFVIAEDIGAEVVYYGDGKGLVGALAAIGADLSPGKTYELIAHRAREYWGMVRRVDPASIYEMDEATREYTFDNVDYETGDIKITPHTPCPVLLGIRGIDPGVLKKAFEMLRIGEPVEYVTIFETNQATDVHYQRCRIRDLRDCLNAIVEGTVSEAPRREIGGHVFFRINDGEGELTCAAYEPTKSFRDIIMQLTPGDEVTVYGAVKLKPQGLTLNLEKIQVRKLARKMISRPPLCPDCGKRMKSLGSGKGYKCRKCGKRVGKEAVDVVEVPRELQIGFYEVTPAARRHLVKPLDLSL